jgi:hypothetical protein
LTAPLLPVSLPPLHGRNYTRVQSCSSLVQFAGKKSSVYSSGTYYEGVVRDTRQQRKHLWSSSPTFFIKCFQMPQNQFWSVLVLLLFL